MVEPRPESEEGEHERQRLREEPTRVSDFGRGGISILPEAGEARGLGQDPIGTDAPSRKVRRAG